MIITQVHLTFGKVTKKFERLCNFRITIWIAFLPTLNYLVKFAFIHTGFSIYTILNIQWVFNGFIEKKNTGWNPLISKGNGISTSLYKCKEMIFPVPWGKMMTSYPANHFPPWDWKYLFITLKDVEMPHFSKSFISNNKIYLN